MTETTSNNAPIKISGNPEYDEFRCALGEIIYDPKTVWPRKFFAHVLEDQGYEDFTPDLVVAAICAFYDEHTEPSADLAAFLVKCRPDERRAIEALADPKYNLTIAKLSRRKFVAKVGLITGGLASISGVMGLAQDDTTRHESNPPASRDPTGEAAVLLGAGLTFHSIVELMRSVKETKEAHINHAATKPFQKEVAIKLLSDMNEMIDAASAQMLKEERRSKPQQR